MKLVYYIFLFIFTVLLIILISDYRNIKKNIVILEEVPKKEDFGLNVKFEQKIPLKIYKTHKKDVIKILKKK